MNQTDLMMVSSIAKKSKSHICSVSCFDNFLKHGKLKCQCGEDTKIFDWCWESDKETNKILSNGNKEVLFHPIYSSGTACVKGDTPFKPNYHYYWEIKIISSLYGTDVMIGVGTSKVTPEDWRLNFCSMLGFDSQSWGYSYHGRLHHDKQKCKYGVCFGLGSIIGVHLDMAKGTLQYYLNRKPLGIAFTNLKKYELYPMVSSTAAQSAIKLNCAINMKSTLSLDCMKIIGVNPLLLQNYNKIPGLARIFEKQYFWCIPPNKTEKKLKQLELEDEVVLPKRKIILRQKRKRVVVAGYAQLLYFTAKRNCNLNDNVKKNTNSSTVNKKIDQPGTSKESDSSDDVCEDSLSDTDSEHSDSSCLKCDTCTF